MLNFNSLSIRKQIFIALLTIVILTTILLGSIQYYFSSTSIRNEYQAAHVNAIEVANNVLEIQLRAIVDEQRTFLRNQHVTSLLRKNNKDEEGFSTFDNRILLNELQRTLFSNQAIRDIMLVSMQGNLIFTSQNDMNRRYISHYRNKDDILQEAWVRQCDAASGQEVFFHSNILFSSDKEDAFSVAKKLLDEKYEPLAYIVFNIRKSSLSAVFGKHNEGNETSDYMILDSSNLTEKDLPKLVYSSLPVSEKETDSIMLAFANQDTNKKYVFTGTKNAISKWEVVNVISQKELASRSSYVGKIGGVVALLVIGLSIPLSSVIARRITKPISILKQTMRNVESGNLRVDAEFDESEVGQLGQQFKHLVNNNLDLKDRLLKANLREREAELLLLQSQINPHFLYNTLDTLYFMAIINHEDEIAEFVQALSENFKLSLNKGAKLIPIGDEIARIQAYLKIQNYRFQDRYDLKIDIEDDLRKEYILTFILQPLVENSVLHGLEPKPGSGIIKISGKIVDGLIELYVCDDGVGIEDMDRIDRGYGLKNVRERIRLFYGEEYGIRFANKEDGGTIAKISIPQLSVEEVEATLKEEEERDNV